MVVKVDRLDWRDDLGQTSRYPRWTVAFKYEPDRAWTKLQDVKVQVGKLGTLTPVAVLEPVLLAGTTVGRATLHNYEQIERLGVMIGDTVAVEKAGEIIPQVVQVDFEKRPKDARPIRPPKECPACKGPAQREEGEVALRCVNPECPAQIRQRVEFFAGRNQMDIDGLGPALVDQLVTDGKVRHFADLYALKPEDLAGMEISRHERDGKTIIARMQPDNAGKLVKAIEASKARGLARLLAALGVRHVGERASELLAGHFGDIDAIAKASVEELRIN